MNAAQVLQTMVIKLLGDGSSYEKTLADAEMRTERAVRKISNIGKRMQGIGTKLSLGVTLPLLGIGGGLLKAAADAEETRNKFNVVFRDVAADARAATDTLKNFYGVSGSQAERLLSNTGDLLTGFGFDQKMALDLSNQVNKLAVDLASFTNVAGGTEAASEALTKAMLGEAESAKSLGIVISQDNEEYKKLVANYRENQGMTLMQAKAMAALTTATNQSKNALGDFARSQDSFTNQTRIFRADVANLAVELGTMLLPVAQTLLGWLRQGVTWFSNLDKSTKKTIMVVAGLAAALGPLLLGLGSLAVAIPAIVTGITALTSAVTLLSMNPMAIGFAAVAVAAVKAYQAVSKFKELLEDGSFKSGDEKGFSDQEWAKHQAIGAKLDAALANPAKYREEKRKREAEARAAAAATPATVAAIPRLTEGTEAYAKAMEMAAQITEASITPAERYAKEITDLDQHFREGRITADTYHRSIMRLGEAFEETKVTEDMKKAMEDAKVAMEEATYITDAALTPTERYAKEVANLKKHLEAGRITNETYTRTIAQMDKDLAELQKKSEVRVEFKVGGIDAVEAGTAEALGRLEEFRALQKKPFGPEDRAAPGGVKPVAGTGGAGAGGSADDGDRGILAVLKLIELNTRNNGDFIRLEAASL